MNIVFQWWKKYPFECIVASALFFRLVAAFFAKGFGMSDDHFLVIEPAQAWVDGVYSPWLPQGENAPVTPTGHSFFYPGLHYLLFKFLLFFGIKGPQLKMLIVRLIHALYSMTTVIYGYKITRKIGGERAARHAGLLLGLLWFFPFLSVRNLVEVACIPVLVLATWMAVRKDTADWKDYLLAGMLLGVGFNIRFQTFFFTAGFGLALLLKNKWRPSLITALGFLLVALSFQGICDYLIWKKPFVEFGEYVRYNLENSRSYFNKPWYNYIPLLLGIFIPPLSLFLLFGFFRSPRKNLITFLPSFLFFLFHSYFPNKQERFILPMLPFVIILGISQWEEFLAHSSFWKNRQKLYRASWKFIICINALLLTVITLSYSKRNRVESMTWLSKKNDVHGIIIDDSNRGEYLYSPLFYLGKWVPEVGVTNQTDTTLLFSSLKSYSDNTRPNYILFHQTENLEERKKKFEEHFILSYQTTIEPSLIDAIMHQLNKRNVNNTTVIYRVDRKKDPV